MTAPLSDALIERLRKVWAMRSSSFLGERKAAEDAAERLLGPYGFDLRDVEGLLARAGMASPASGEPAPPPSASGLWERAERARAAPARMQLLARYGSFEAVIAWIPPELVLRAAVSHWSTYDGIWTTVIDGWCCNSLQEAPERVRKAIAGAYPLPATVADAWSEFRFWQDRDRDLKLAYDLYSDTQLDSPAELRREMVGDLVGHGLRCRSVAELHIRYRYQIDFGRLGQNEDDDEVDAVLRDLEHLAGLEAVAAEDGRPAVARSAAGDPTTRGRREAVKRILSTLDGCALSDREIARRVGVSPQTVGNIRRRSARSTGI